MGSPKKPKPTPGERALAEDGVYKWNDYVDRYTLTENKFVESNQATPDKVAAARNVVNADAGMAHGDAVKAADEGLSAQGVAPGAGRSALGHSGLADARAEAGGLGQAIAAQGVYDRQQAAGVKMSAFGRNLQDNTSLALNDSARTAHRAMLNKYETEVNQRNSMFGTAASAAGAGLSAYRARVPPPTSGSPLAGKLGLTGLNNSTINRFMRFGK